MHAQFAERGNSPTDIFTRLPPPALASAAASASDGLGASSSRGSLDRERTSSPQLLPSPLATVTSAPQPSPTPAHPPIAYKVLSPFKRSRASLSQDPTHSNSSISLAGATPPPCSRQHKQQPIKSLLSEGNVIRRKLSIILTRQKEPQQQQQQQQRRPLSISSISSSVSPQESQQSNSLRSLQTAAESISSRAARIDTSVVSAATGSSSNTDPPAPAPAPAPKPVPVPKSAYSARPPLASPATSAAAAALRRASVYSGSDTVSLHGPAASPSASAPAPTTSSSSKSPLITSTTGTIQDTHRTTRRGRGQSVSKTSNGNCTLQ
jgi:hypothetical protein